MIRIRVAEYIDSEQEMISKKALRRMRERWERNNQDRILDKIVHGRKKKKVSSVWTVSGGLLGSGKRS
jgi:hypothetical protein